MAICGPFKLARCATFDGHVVSDVDAEQERRSRDAVTWGAMFRKSPVAPKKDAGPNGPASQTGRLHVWEKWDHEDPEFRTRSAETARVEDLSGKYATAAGLLGGKIGTLACERCMPFSTYAILHLMTLKNVSQPPCAAGNPGTRRCAWNAAIPRGT